MPGYLSFQLREDLRNFTKKIVSEDNMNAMIGSLEDRMEDLEDRIEDGLAEYELTQPVNFSINISKFSEDVVELSVCTVGKEDSDLIRSRVENEFSEFLKDALNIVMVIKVTEVIHALLCSGSEWYRRWILEDRDNHQCVYEKHRSNELILKHSDTVLLYFTATLGRCG